MNFYINNLDNELATILSSDKSGSHTPVISASIEEKLSSYDQLFLSIPSDLEAEEAGHIKEDYTVVFRDTKGWREYIINVIEDEDTGNPEKNIEADLSSIELRDEIIEEDLSGSTISARNLLESMLEGTRWQVGHVDTSIYTQRFSSNTEYVSVLEALDLLSSNYSCEIQFSYTVSGNKISGRYVNLYRTFGRKEGKRFEIGKDVSEIKRTVDTTSIKTAVIPMGREPEEVTETDEETGEETSYTPERLDITGVEWSKENGDPVDKPLGQNWLGSPSALENFGKLDDSGEKRHRKFFQEIDVESGEQLISMAWIHLSRYINPKVTYEAKVHDIYILSDKDKEFEHEHVFLGDTVIVTDNNFKVPIHIETRIIEMKRDLINPIANELVLGESRTLFTNSETLDRVEELEKTITEQIRDVRTTITSVQESADGRTRIFRGSVRPTGMNIHDLWFRPNPTKPQYKQMLIWNGTSWDLLADDADLEDASRLQVGTIDASLLNVINLNADSIAGGNLDLSKGISIKAGNLEVLKVDTETGEVEINATAFRVRAMDLQQYIKLQIDETVTYSVEIRGRAFFNSSIDVNTLEAVLLANGTPVLSVDGKPLAYRWFFVDPLTKEQLGDWERTGRQIQLKHEDLPSIGRGAQSNLEVEISIID